MAIRCRQSRLATHASRRALLGGPMTRLRTTMTLLPALGRAELVRFAFVALVCCGLACKRGEKPDAPESVAAEKRGPHTITIWWAQWAPADGLQELGKEYEKETGVSVKVHQIPWSNYQDQVFLNFGN